MAQISRANRQFGIPVLLQSESGPETPLELIQPGDPPFREDRLQEILATHPNVLPVGELEPAYAPLVCLGREIGTPSGFLDLLYVSPLGYLTLIEAKLWDNPQARREVVGQIVEYAKDFSRWSFDDLDQAVRKAGTAPNGILAAVKQMDPDVDEAAFIDTVARGLSRGLFLLLVVGNGIREGVESLAEFLQRTPSLHFNLSLIELALYRTLPGEDWPILVQPRTVARTAEVIRAVVEVRAPAGIEVQVRLPSDEETAPSRSRRTISEEAFFEQLATATARTVATQVGDLIHELQQIGLVPRWRGTGVSMRLPDPAGLSRFWTVLFLGADGMFWLGYLRNIENAGYPREIWRHYLDEARVLLGLEIYPNLDDATRAAPVGRLLSQRGAFLPLAERYVSEIQSLAESISDPG